MTYHFYPFNTPLKVNYINQIFKNNLHIIHDLYEKVKYFYLILGLLFFSLPH